MRPCSMPSSGDRDRVRLPLAQRGRRCRIAEVETGSPALAGRARLPATRRRLDRIAALPGRVALG